MMDEQEGLKLALQVLEVIASKKAPDPRDLALIEYVFGRRPPEIAWDDFLCDIIQTALKRKGMKRDGDGHNEDEESCA